MIAGRKAELIIADTGSNPAGANPNVSQFCKYPPQAFLRQPVYSRDFPPAKNLEQ